MKLNRKKFFQIHSWIGIQLSILFFLVCFSGTLAVLSHEMDWLFNPEMRAEPQKELASRNLIYHNFKKSFPDAELTYWAKSNEPYLCDIMYAYNAEKDHTKYVFANPYTGEIQGSSNLTIQRFFRDFHYYLFIPFNQIGNYTVLVFSFFLLASTITALVFYKKWYKKLFQLTLNKGPLVLWRSAHRLIGLWSLPFALLFSITGIWYFVERADVGNVSKKLDPKVPELDSKYYADYSKEDKFSLAIDIDSAIRIAQNEIPGLKIEKIILPRKHGNYIYLNGESHVPLVRSRANRVYINPYNFEVAHVQKAENLNWQTYTNDIADPLHFGYWGGIWAKIIWFIMGLGISGLILSGTWIAIKRTFKKKRKTAKMNKVMRFVNYAITLGFVFFMYGMLITYYKVGFHVLLMVSISLIITLITAYLIYIKPFKTNQKSGKVEREKIYS